MKTEWNSVSNEVTLQPNGMPMKLRKKFGIKHLILEK